MKIILIHSLLLLFRFRRLFLYLHLICSSSILLRPTVFTLAWWRWWRCWSFSILFYWLSFLSIL